MRGTNSCCELTDSERRILRLCRLHTVCLLAHVFVGFADQHIKICRCVCVGNKEESEIKKDRWVQLSSPVVNRIRDKMMFQRLVLNMQPTPSAIFSRMLESVSVSVCFSVLWAHVAVWVCMLPRGSISLYEIVHSLAPSMGKKR